MTEHNIFCYAKNHNDDDSFQQKRYRVFNVIVDKERYYEIKESIKEIIPNTKNLKLSDFWKSITPEQWNKLLAIPEAKDFKEGFEYISGIKIETIKEKTYTIGDVEYSESTLKNLIKKSTQS
jgi:hypothetical protein